MTWPGAIMDEKNDIITLFMPWVDDISIQAQSKK